VAPSQIYSLAAQKGFTLLSSPLIITELQSVLIRDKFARYFQQVGKTVQDVLNSYAALSEIVLFTESVSIASDVIRDPEDIIILSCAVVGKADFIVSGDGDLLSLGQFQNIPIVTAADFLKIWADSR
jgi:putative PIN family toxin of toxin-antitoxin system